MNDTQRPGYRDPTPNVREIVRTSVERQDTLRDAEARRIDEAVASLRQRSIEHEKYGDMQIEHLREMAKLRADHAREMAEKESDRIDAILANNATGVTTAAEKAASATATLAATTASLRETTAASLNSARQEMAIATAEAARGVDTRITGLEKSNARGEGRQLRDDPVISALVDEMKHFRMAQAESVAKARSTDPQVAALVAEVARLTASQAHTSGAGVGMRELWGWLVAVAVFVLNIYLVYKTGK